MSGDPCECVFDHAAMMRRLISLLRDSQNDCTDTDCTSSLPNMDASGNGTMVMIAMAWGLLAMFLFFMRPSSMRSNGNQFEGKPSQGDGQGGNGNEEPPAPDVH